MAHSEGRETEMELAFLPKRLPEGLTDVKPKRVVDIYLSDDGDLLTKLRLRSSNDKYELTKKVVNDPKDFSVQDEYNTPLSRQEFELFSTLQGRTVVKDRYVINIEGNTAEIDIFQGLLCGLVLVEFEFIGQDQKSEFVPPELCGPEVTQEDFIAGAYLAGKSYADISGALDQFGYKVLRLEGDS